MFIYIYCSVQKGGQVLKYGPQNPDPSEDRETWKGEEGWKAVEEVWCKKTDTEFTAG